MKEGFLLDHQEDVFHLGQKEGTLPSPGGETLLRREEDPLLGNRLPLPG